MCCQAQTGEALVYYIGMTCRDWGEISIVWLRGMILSFQIRMTELENIHGDINHVLRHQLHMLRAQMDYRDRTADQRAKCRLMKDNMQVEKKVPTAHIEACEQFHVCVRYRETHQSGLRLCARV